METDYQLLDIYAPITDADIKEAQRYVTRREVAAVNLSSIIDELLKEAATTITEICYRYGVDPKRFTLTSKYNEKMFDEVVDVLDDLEYEIMGWLEDYATRCAEDEKSKNILLLWVLLLGRKNRNLEQTLQARLRMFLGDMEAAIAAMVQAKVSLTDAVTKIKSGLHAVYMIPEVRAAFSRSVMMQARNIRTKGVKKGNVGNSNSEANNIIRFGEITVQMAWMHYQLTEYQEQGAAGYYVFRGSNYPCENLCDLHTGFHPITDTESYPPQHGHCMCYAVPVFMSNHKK